MLSEKLNAELDRLRKDSQSKQEEIHNRESALHKMKEETLKIKSFGDQINKYCNVPINLIVSGCDNKEMNYKL